MAILAFLAPAPAAAGASVRRPANTGLSARPQVRGLDISAYQHKGHAINWRTLARHGIRFVAIKVSEGTYYTNPYERSDARLAAAAGLAVLPYVFANPRWAGGAATARFAVRAAHYRRSAAALPLALDLENDPYGRGNCYGLNVRRMIAWISGFMSRAVALTGKWPVIYTTAAWWRECTRATRRFRRSPLWLAAFDVRRPAVPAPWRHWTLWQYKDNGSLPGIGPADLDYYQPASGPPSLQPMAKLGHKPGSAHARKVRREHHGKARTRRADKSRHLHKVKHRPRTRKSHRSRHNDGKAPRRKAHKRKHKGKAKSERKPQD